MSDWVATHAAEIAARAPRELEALVGVSSPSGDVRGAEECAAVCAALAPEGADAERIDCSSPHHAPDLLLRLHGSGTRRLLLLGHLDTVVGHHAHRPLEHAGGRYTGSGTIDMKGGDVMALGVMRALAGRPEDFGQVALLLVCDEEWRQAPFAHAARFAGWDACLCFEAGERAPGGDDAVIVRRKAAGAVRVTATGRASHAGASPEKGRNALLALAEVARLVAARNAPDGPDHLTAVPTVLHSGDALNVVPAAGELTCDVRADELAPIEALIATLPSEHAGVELTTDTLRLWPGMHTGDVAAPVLSAAAAALGRPLVPGARGGASDASHMATTVPCTIDGLGPRGGNAHHPDEFLLAESLQSRAEVALAVAQAVLA